MIRDQSKGIQVLGGILLGLLWVMPTAAEAGVWGTIADQNLRRLVSDPQGNAWLQAGMLKALYPKGTALELTLTQSQPNMDSLTVDFVFRYKYYRKHKVFLRWTCSQTSANDVQILAGTTYTVKPAAIAALSKFMKEDVWRKIGGGNFLGQETPAATSQWVKKAETALAELWKQQIFSNETTAGIIKFTHPTAKEPRASYTLASKGQELVVKFALDFKGSVLGGDHRTIVEWRVTQGGHQSAKVTEDTASLGKARKGALDGYFKGTTYVVLLNRISGLVGLAGSWTLDSGDGHPLQVVLYHVSGLDYFWGSGTASGSQMQVTNSNYTPKVGGYSPIKWTMRAEGLADLKLEGSVNPDMRSMTGTWKWGSNSGAFRATRY